jgi:hypothetical protein
MKNKSLILLLCVPFSAIAQNNTVAAGGAATGASGTATYTVGQIFYQTNIAPSGTITPGIQQPFEIVTLGTNETPQIQLEAVVFPNPTVQNVTLRIKDLDFTDLNFMLFDGVGRIISKGKILKNETQIEMANLPAANYFLKVANTNKLVKTFKIIKNK